MMDELVAYALSASMYLPGLTMIASALVEPLNLPDRQRKNIRAVIRAWLIAEKPRWSRLTRVAIGLAMIGTAFYWSDLVDYFYF